MAQQMRSPGGRRVVSVAPSVSVSAALDEDLPMADFHNSRVAGNATQNDRSSGGGNSIIGSTSFVLQTTFVQEAMTTARDREEHNNSATHKSCSGRCSRLFWALCDGNPMHGTMPNLAAFLHGYGNLGFFIDSCLRGLGQVIFINNPITGLFVIAAALVNSYYLCLMSLLGLVSSTCAAWALGFSKDAIACGLYGYNGYLVGIAIALFAPGWGSSDWNPLLIGPIVICAGFSAVVVSTLAHLFVRIADRPVAVFTLPFHIITWSWLLGAQQYAYFPMVISPALSVPTTADGRTPISYDVVMLVKAVFVGIAEVFFMAKMESGVMLLAGVLAASYISGIAALLGSTIGVLMAVALGAPVAAVYDGLWGYNPTLAAICVGGMFFRLTRRTAVLAVAAAVFSCILTGAVGSFLKPVGLPALTFPAAVTGVFFCVMGNTLPHDRPLLLSDITIPEDQFRPWVGEDVNV